MKYRNNIIILSVLILVLLFFSCFRYRREYFENKVYNIDEFRTSCLHHKTENKCKNLYLEDKTNKLRKLHSVLTYKMENTWKGCINRDYNGCLNMMKIL